MGEVRIGKAQRRRGDPNVACLSSAGSRLPITSAEFLFLLYLGIPMLMSHSDTSFFPCSHFSMVHKLANADRTASLATLLHIIDTAYLSLVCLGSLKSD